MMFRISVPVLLIAPLLLATAWAGTIVVVDNPDPMEHVISFDGRAVLDLTPLTPISPDSFNINLFNATFPDWTVVNGGPSPGVFGVTRYIGANSVGSGSGNVGGNLELIYDNGVPIPAGEQRQWVQFVNRNVNDGRTYPLIDRLPGDPLPFYPLDPMFTSLSDNAHGFYDFSGGGSNPLNFGDPHRFEADLFLVNWNGDKQIAVRDGVHWGWAISSATRGESSGIFSNPMEPCPPAVCSGVGTSAVTWGTGFEGSPPSHMEFEGKEFNPLPNQDFVLGTLEYFNGTITSSGLPPFCNAEHIQHCEDFGIVQINLDVLLAYDNVPEFNQTLEVLIANLDLSNDADPTTSASNDLFNLFINCPHDDICDFSSGFISVSEGETVRKDIIARLHVPGVDLPGFGSPDDVSFEIPAPFREVVLQLDIVGLVDSADNGVGAEVPEPTTLFLFGSGLVALGLLSRRLRTT